MDGVASKECIIHQASFELQDRDKRLISPNTCESWASLLEAAKIREHMPLLEAATSVTDNEIPTVVYHRYCRSIFTMPKLLEKIKTKSGECTEDKSNECLTRRRHVSDSSLIVKRCAFCQKDKYIKNTRSRESLRHSTDSNTDITLREAALRRKDHDLIAVTNEGNAEAKFMYHSTCYRTYTRGDKFVTEDSTTNKELYTRTLDDAYEQLFSYIEKDIIPNRLVVPLTSLFGKLKTLMISKGVSEIKRSTQSHIGDKLRSKFGEKVSLLADKKENMLVVPYTVNVPELVVQNQVLKEELNAVKCKDPDSKSLQETALHLRKSVKKNAQHQQQWPVRPEDVTDMHSCVPDDLHYFLSVLLTGNVQGNPASKKIKVSSIGQDIVYAVTNAKQKTPKHLLLSYGVKTLTGNREVIQMLNKFGHGVSYHFLEENDTALCLQKLARAENERLVLPKSVQPLAFTNLAFDNIDRLEETLTGGGTTHRVNGIAVQPQVFGPKEKDTIVPALDISKQRTLKIETKHLEMYVSGQRTGPHPLKALHQAGQQYIQESLKAKQKDLIWSLARQVDTIDQKVPGWTGFNIKIRDSEHIIQDVISYLPTINAPATELATVQEILLQSEYIRKTLCLNSIVLVLDQALYAKAAEIVWKHRDKYMHIVLRLGTFHTLMNVLAVLGKRFQDAGLRDLCIESGILAEGSTTSVLEGKMYNRGIRVHKCVLEALLRMILKTFPNWISEQYPDMVKPYEHLEELIQTFKEDMSQKTMETLCQNPRFIEIFQLYQEYLQFLRSDNGQLSSFWMSYIDIVQGVLLGLLRASREGNWYLHLHAIREMIPWCFALDKLNYARYLSPYYAAMTRLELDHPDVFQAFQQGRFSVQLSEQNTFGRIPVDQTIEVTVNKDTQTVGGTTRFSTNPSAVSRYYLVSEYRSEFLTRLREITGSPKSDFDHCDLQSSRLATDEQAVTQVEQTLASWINPFEVNCDLLSVSTGAVAPTEVAHDLINARDKGESAYNAFKSERLEADPPKKKFHDPLKKLQLKTFSAVKKQSELKSKDGRSIILKADRSLFGRMIVIGQNRQLDMRQVLSFPLGPLPWALATPDGHPRKTNKASLAAAIKERATLAEEVPSHSAVIIDVKGLVHRVRVDEQNQTFSKISEAIFAMAMKEGANCTRIDIVFDCYRELSIKFAERDRRSHEFGLKVHNVSSSQMIKQWKKFLDLDSNKTEFIRFLSKEWRGAMYMEKLAVLKKVFYFTCEEQCYRVTGIRSREVIELRSSQEEADGRMVMHAAHAAEEGFEAVVISSADTDVLLLNLAFQQQVKAKLLQKCGNSKRTQLIDIQKTAQTLGQGACNALLGMHAYTGCDSISAFAGKGKVNAFKMLIKNDDVQQTFFELGQKWSLTDNLFERLEVFTCSLYGSKKGADVNALRYSIFCARNGEVESFMLPPSQDCLRKHSMRANYQAAVWKRALQADPETPDPCEHGWKLRNEKLVIHWMEVKPAPEAVLQFLSCKCKKICTWPSCLCLFNGLRCTYMCTNKDCSNFSTDDCN